MEQMETKNLIAERLYKAPYNRLSAFAQNHIDEIWKTTQERLPNHPIAQSNSDIQQATMEERLSLLNRRISNLEMEYEEIWIENTELKNQLASLQAEINQRSS